VSGLTSAGSEERSDERPERGGKTPPEGSRGSRERSEQFSTVLALDIGGTKLAAGVVDGSGHTHSFLVAPTRPERGARPVLERLFALGRRAVAESGLGWRRIGAVGIGCGGPLDFERGVLLCPPHLPGWRDVPVTAWAEEEFGRPAVLDNDATAAAAGEHAFGAGVGTRHMVYLTLSTGVGGGAIVAGKLYRGAAGNGGELGHVTVDRDGRLCRSCGRRGCLEAYVSGTSIAERAREAMAGGRSTALATLDRVTAADVQAAAAAGDPLAAEVWRETTAALACGLTSIVNLLEPELVVLGGGVTRAGDQLIAPVREAVAAGAMGPAARAVRIVRAARGERAGVVGAAAIALERLTPGGAGPVAEDPAAQVAEHLAVAGRVEALVPRLRAVAGRLIEVYAGGGRLYTFGNGGSAADAQHLAAELVGRYRRERSPLPAVALTVDPSVLTCIGNDYAYEDVFARQVRALVGPGDMVIGFSTTGRSPNVARALAAARERAATTVLFTGGDGGPAARHADHALIVPSRTTARIQEMHLLFLHLLSEQVDAWAAGEESA
jgi:glucokinase